MGFKMNGSPAKMGTIQGTAGHSSALKMKVEADAASALKQMEVKRKDAGVTKADDGSVTFNATGTEFNTNKRDGIKTVKVNPNSKVHKKLSEQRWKQGDKASGGTLNELVADRKKHKKGSAEYAEIQNKINKALGSKKVHKVTPKEKEEKEVEGGVPTVITDDQGTEDKSDDTTTTENRMRGLQRKKGKTLTPEQKAAEKAKIKAANVKIKEGKSSKDKNVRDAAQLEKAEIKAGRDDKYTGTMLSRALARRKAKRNKKQLAKRAAKENEA